MDNGNVIEYMTKIGREIKNAIIGFRDFDAECMYEEAM